MVKLISRCYVCWAVLIIHDLMEFCWLAHDPALLHFISYSTLTTPGTSTLNTHAVDHLEHLPFPPWITRFRLGILHILIGLFNSDAVLVNMYMPPQVPTPQRLSQISASSSPHSSPQRSGVAGARRDLTPSFADRLKAQTTQREKR